MEDTAAAAAVIGGEGGDRGENTPLPDAAWACAVEAAKIIREGGGGGTERTGAAVPPRLAALIFHAMRDFEGPSRCADSAVEIRDYIGRRAAKRGLLGVLELLASEGARPSDGISPLFGWTVARRAAAARQFGDVLRWLLSSPGRGDFHPVVAESVISSRAPVTDIIEALEWIYRERDGSPARRVYLKGLLSAVRYVSEEGGGGGGAGGAAAVLDWIRGRWPGQLRALAPEEVSSSILNDRSPPISNCIPALDWVLRRSPIPLRLSDITSRLVAASERGGSVELFAWLYAAEEDAEREEDGPSFSLDWAGRRRKVFDRHAAIEGAVCSGNVPLLDLFWERGRRWKDVIIEGEESDILTDPNTGALAARHGQTGALRWLVETAGNTLSPDAAACAFAYGQPDVLEYLYFEAGAPFGAWRGRGHAGASVATECWEFYKKYGDDWACGLYPAVNVKPAASPSPSPSAAAASPTIGHE